MLLPLLRAGLEGLVSLLDCAETYDGVLKRRRFDTQISWYDTSVGCKKSIMPLIGVGVLETLNCYHVRCRGTLRPMATPEFWVDFCKHRPL